MKPLISYYGGKQRIVSHILPYIESIPHTIYGEPFAGGLAVLFNKKVPNKNYSEFINDTSDLLINMYRVAIKYPEQFQREIEATLYSQSDHRKSVQILKNPSDYDEMTLAWAYYVNINFSFAKKINGGWGTTRFDACSEPRRLNNKKLRLRQVLDRLSRIYISCEDAISCIKRWDSPQTLIYCDPPYPNTSQGHYKGYTTSDWQDLCNCLDNCQSSYVLSNYQQEIEPQSAQQKIEIKTVMSASRTSNNSKRTEILWIYNRSRGMRSDLINHARTIQHSLF